MKKNLKPTQNNSKKIAPKKSVSKKIISKKSPKKVASKTKMHRSSNGEKVDKYGFPTKPSKHEQPIESLFGNMSERLMRIQRDLLMPAYLFEKERMQNTITFFGSAQTKSRAVALQMVKDAESALKKSKTPANHDKLKRAHKTLAMSRYYEAAEDLASRLQQWSNCLMLSDEDKFYIMTGGGPGIMEAANRGAHKSGGKTAGLTIFIADEQRRNDYVSPELGINFHYFLMRKFWLLFFAKALVIFPGGTGTMDEFFEAYTLIKTQKTEDCMPVILFGSEFWEKVIDFQHMVDSEVITEHDLNLFKIIDSVDEAFDYITSELTKRYLKK